MRRVTMLGLCAAALVAATGSTAEYDRQWPTWRGPRSTGAAPHATPPTTWSETDNVRWKVELPGKGLSSPIVWHDRVYVTTAIALGEEPARPTSEDGDDAGEAPHRRGRMRGVSPDRELEYAVLAIDRKTGDVTWKTAVRSATPHEGTHRDASWASASAVTDGEVLIVQFGSNGTYALDLDGKILWERDLGDMTTRLGFGEGSSPALHGDTVIVNWDHEGDSFIAALDRKTGDELWRKDRDEPTSWSTPVIVQRGDQVHAIVAATGATRAYDIATGDVVWSATGMTANAIPSPVVLGDRVIVMSGFRGNALQAIDFAKAEGALDGSAAIAWQHDEDTPYVPSPVLVGERLYFLKHNKAILSCFDARSGQPHYQRQRLDALQGVYASLVAADGRVYVVGRNGVTAVLRDGPELEVLATNELDDSFDASPAIAGDELFLRGRKALYCLGDSSDDR